MVPRPSQSQGNIRSAVHRLQDCIFLAAGICPPVGETGPEAREGSLVKDWGQASPKAETRLLVDRLQLQITELCVFVFVFVFLWLVSAPQWVRLSPRLEQVPVRD